MDNTEHWIFHPTEKAKVVGTLEYRELLNNGWYDSPLKFPKKEAQGLAAPIEVEAPVPEKKKKVKAAPEKLTDEGV